MTTTTFNQREVRRIQIDGGDVWIRTLSAREHYNIWRRRIDEQDLTDFEAATLLVLLATCWGDGTPCYDPDSPEDLAAVADWDFQTFDKVLGAVREHCGLTKRSEDVEKK